MKGFVPVSKASLLEMVVNCRKEIDSQQASEKAEWLDRYVTQERERMITRRWYRLWQFPKKSHFACDEASVIAYSASIDYPMFDGCPFQMIEKDANNSRRWVDRIERLAQSDYAGEPIQIDLDTFQRLSEPHRYYWVRASGICYTVN